MKNEQKNQKVKYGDYVLLGSLLGITPDNARMRLKRQKEDAVKGLEKIIETREKLQKQFEQEKENKDQ